MSKSIVYSYLRFSDPKQAEGHSAERQLDYARRWAADHGMTLDNNLSMRDEGLSAYHQAHVKHGALGAFLAAIEDGRIPAGSVLIVEGLDRLSRAEPIQAQAQLAQIVNGGITVVTASDNKEYNRERLKANPMDLVYSLLVMIRAHEESETKSVRVKAAIRRQCEGWIAGTYRGIIRNGRDPSWLKWDGSTWHVIEERAAALRDAIDMYISGDGAARILNRGNPLLVQNATTFHRQLRSPNLIGNHVITVGDEEYVLEGYYPPIISIEKYNELQVINNSRIRRKGKGDIPNLITGMKIARCGYCGESLSGQVSFKKSARRKADGVVWDSNRRLLCVSNSSTTPCPVKGSCSVVPIERALLAYCSDQMRLDSLTTGNDRTQAVRATLAALRLKAAEIERQLQRITDALLADTESTPITFARRARELEAQSAELEQKIRNAEAELQHETDAAKTPAQASAWSELATKVMELDYEARMKVRKLVSDTFSKIVVWHSGNPPEPKQNIDVLLISRSGASRLITISKQTGEWVEGLEHNLQAE